MNERQTEFLDLLIIGAGPAGISAAATAEQLGLRYLVLEKGWLAQTIFRYPVGRLVFSTPNELEMEPNTLQPCRTKPTREELLSYYVRYALKNKLKLRLEEEVLQLSVTKNEGFRAVTTRGDYYAARLLVTTGAMAQPRRLGVAGENLPKVAHRFVEPYPYVGKEVMVIGGGNSAAEATLFLAEDGARTSLAIRRTDWEETDPARGAIKAWVREPLLEQIAQGNLRIILLDAIEEITSDAVRLRRDDGTTESVPNDAVFVLIGHEPDFTLLRQLGVGFEQIGKRTFPVYDAETFETNIAGVYVAGHFTQARHIKEAIAVPRRIVPLIAAGLPQSCSHELHELYELAKP